MDDWVDVRDRLPMADRRDENTINEYLVTVQFHDNDPNDDPEVMLLWFHSKRKVWLCQDFSEYDWGWIVTAWQEKPEPSTRRKV